ALPTLRRRGSERQTSGSYLTDEVSSCTVLSTKLVDNVDWRSLMPRFRLVLAVIGLALGSAAAAGAASTTLVAYSTPKTVMGGIIQAWQASPDGKDVSVTQSYGASTDQAKAVAAGLPADVVFLSTGDDVNLLVDAGLVDGSWSRQSVQGIAADTDVVFAVRID